MHLTEPSVSSASNLSRRRIQLGAISIIIIPNHISKPLRVLKYVNRAIAHTDVPDQLPEFISQRRRWLNGSFFAATYAIAHTGQILRSGHSLGRKIVLGIQVVYSCINLTFSWFSIVSLRCQCESSIFILTLLLPGQLLPVLRT